jgi:hypothetical protein
VRPNAALYLARGLPAYNDARAGALRPHGSSTRKAADMKIAGAAKIGIDLKRMDSHE